jgi:hypothetical protein
MTALFNERDRKLYNDLLWKSVKKDPQLTQYPLLPIINGGTTKVLIGGGGIYREYALAGSQVDNPTIPFRQVVKRESMPVLKMESPVDSDSGSEDVIGSGFRNRPVVQRITQKVKEQIMRQHPEIAQHILDGGKYDFKKHVREGDGFKSFFKKLGKDLKPVAQRVVKQVGRVVVPALERVGTNALNKGTAYLENQANQSIDQATSGAGFKSFFKKLGKDLKPVAQRVVKQVGRVVVPALERVGTNALNKGTVYLENQANQSINQATSGGKLRTKKGDKDFHEGGYDVEKSRRPYNEKNKARGELIRKIMAEKKLTLPQASSYIKQHSLSY